jgi:hypothetical protein
MGRQVLHIRISSVNYSSCSVMQVMQQRPLRISPAVRKIVATDFEFENVISLLKYRAFQQRTIFHNYAANCDTVHTQTVIQFTHKQLNLPDKNFNCIFA